MTLLSVNVNKIALLRNSRAGKGPDVVALARVALEAGAAGITVHPRPDRRHITAEDVVELAALLREPPRKGSPSPTAQEAASSPTTQKAASSPTAQEAASPRDAGSTTAHAHRNVQRRVATRLPEFNIEGNPFEGDWLAIVAGAQPDQATLVPDAPGQSTSDHGFEMPADADRLRPIVARLKELGCRVSLFMDPDPAAMRHLRATGADRVELYTESYAEAFARRDDDPAAFDATLRRFADSARAAADAGLGVNAGHDLNLPNLPPFVAVLGADVLLEVSIGHALVGDALLYGMAATVRKYLAALK